MPSPELYSQLCEAARAATTRAFLTREGGIRYGAAVLSRAGKIFSSGQYSSFNHVTNVHAEQAALVIAAISGEADVVALAVASTSADDVTRPCGVCRQVMLEHATRIGCDFTVLMARRNGGYEVAPVSALLPLSWHARSENPTVARGSFRTGTLHHGVTPNQCTIRTGDHLVLRDGTVALVWDDALSEGRLLTKLKYAPAVHDGRRKFAHALTEAFAYERQLREIAWARPAPFGGCAAVVAPEDAEYVLPATPATSEVPPALEETLLSAGVTPLPIFVSGSRALGLATASSDLNLVVRLSADSVAQLRAAIAEAIIRGHISIPERSWTWRLFDRVFPGGKAAIVAQRRFVETVECKGITVAIMLTPLDSPSAACEAEWQQEGRGEICGTVTRADQAPFKRAVFEIESSNGERMEVTAWNKTANLVRVGDSLAVSGWLLRDGLRRRLFQLSAANDSIVWFSTAS